MSILVVGSVAFDTVETPFGKAERVLGGSASFFSVAASFFVPVNLVGVVGRTSARSSSPPSAGRNIDLQGLERMDGETFHWQGKYSYDLNSRDTICTDLNVFEFFKPKIPAAYRSSEIVFLGNIDPVLQRDVLDQVERPRLVACDTMNFWISGKLEELKKTLSRVDILLDQRRRGPRALGRVEHREGGPRHPGHGPEDPRAQEGRARRLDVLRGRAPSPPPPIRWSRSSTRRGRATPSRAASSATWRRRGSQGGDAALRRAVVMGSALASFCVEAFSLDRLLTLTRPEIDERFRLFKRLTHFEEL